MKHHYYIDVFGGCNLRCPSCPVGNSDVPRPKGFMQEDLFRQILEKIRRDAPEVKRVYLYNWTEPVLHPHLPRLIEVAHEVGLRCSLSSNMNLFKNMEAVVAARPKAIRISISGFDQEKYGRTHRKGDVEKVKSNMRSLRETIDRLGVDTKVNILYHCYKDNCGEDLRQVREMCKELRFEFRPVWAFMMPIEKNLAYFENGKLEGEDQELVELLAVKPDEARDIALRNPSSTCRLQTTETVINVDGSVLLCCAVYDADRFTVAKSFLDVPFEDLQAAKAAHPYCGECMAAGGHDIMTYTGLEEWTRIGAERIKPDPVPEGILPPAPRATKRVAQWVRNFLKSS